MTRRVWKWSFRGAEVESVVERSVVKGERKPPKCCVSTGVSIFVPLLSRLGGDDFTHASGADGRGWGVLFFTVWVLVLPRVHAC